MLEQGPSRNTNLQEWDKLWSNNKAIIDPSAPRYTAIAKETACSFKVENGPEPAEARSQPLHPKNESVGTKAVLYGRNLFIERDDAKTIEVGEKVTLMKWGNAVITKKEADGENFKISATIDEDDKDFKKTKKITWICADPEYTTEINIVEFDHLITAPKIEEADKIEDLVNPTSRIEFTAIAEGCVRNLQKGAYFQFERRGYYFVDKLAIGGNYMAVNFIPDGKTKSMSAVSNAVDAKDSAKGKGESIKKKQAEVGADGKISKAALKKAAKKEAKKDGKAAGKAGGEGAKKPAAKGPQSA